MDRITDWNSEKLMAEQRTERHRIEVRDVGICAFVLGAVAGMVLLMVIINWRGGSFSGAPSPTSFTECLHANTTYVSTDVEVKEARQLCGNLFP